MSDFDSQKIRRRKNCAVFWGINEFKSVSITFIVQFEEFILHIGLLNMCELCESRRMAVHTDLNSVECTRVP
jgi:hypothetical protein